MSWNVYSKDSHMKVKRKRVYNELAQNLEGCTQDSYTYLLACQCWSNCCERLDTITQHINQQYSVLLDQMLGAFSCSFMEQNVSAKAIIDVVPPQPLMKEGKQ